MTDARLTQEALEVWTQTTAPAQLTQISVEMWAGSSTGNTQALLTQIALEQWAATGLASSAAQARAMVLA